MPFFSIKKKIGLKKKTCILERLKNNILNIWLLCVCVFLIFLFPVILLIQNLSFSVSLRFLFTFRKILFFIFFIFHEFLTTFLFRQIYFCFGSSIWARLEAAGWRWDFTGISNIKWLLARYHFSVMVVVRNANLMKPRKIGT